MNPFHRIRRLQPKLLLSHLLVVAVGISGVVLGVQVIGPSLFDRLMDGHMGESGLMGGMMTDTTRENVEQSFRSAVFQALLLAGAASTLVAILVGLFVSRRITAPITHLVDVSRRIAEGDYHARVPVGEQDEIGELAMTFNDMAGALEDTERRRANLLGDVAHEIRTPLTTLRGNLEGMLDGVIEPTPQLLAQLYDETNRLSRLIDDLRELSRFEAGSVALRPAPVSVEHLVDVAAARLVGAYAEKHVSLNIHITDGLPAAIADEVRTIQVLTNLLANALRYTPAGGNVTIRARSTGREFEFVVQDTGIGIASEHLPQVFDRFYRVDPARSRGLGGSGIGLTITRALVDAQGGHIWAESPGPGQGSTFGFTLPRA